MLQYVTDLLAKNVGFLVNERFINIPAQVSLFVLSLSARWLLNERFLTLLKLSSLPSMGGEIYKAGIVSHALTEHPAIRRLGAPMGAYN